MAADIPDFRLGCRLLDLWNIHGVAIRTLERSLAFWEWDELFNGVW
jgi:hypothetical protein